MIDPHEAKSFRREELSKHRIVMTNEDAKLVLSAYRPNGEDARDPFFEQALQQAKLDPELMEWFEKQRAFDRVIIAKIRTIEPPASLNSQISCRASGRSGDSSFGQSLVCCGCRAFGGLDGSHLQSIL
jgi:hypothetical protein